MVDQTTGVWTAEEDYSKYPKQKWCNLDYVANWIKQKKYIPETSIENVSYKILGYYESEEFPNGYFEIKDNLEYPGNLMINILDVAAYVEASGGIEEFDYE